MIDQCLEYPCTEAAGAAAVACIALFAAWTWWDYRKLRRDLLEDIAELEGASEVNL